MSPTGTAHPPSGAPQVDPRMRDRWVLARRQEGRRRLRWLLAAAGAVVFVGAGVGVVESPLLAAEHVTVTGASHETAAQVITAGGLAAHPAMVTLGTGTVAQRIERRLPWVATARVARHWPDRVSVALTERTAVAVVPASVVRSPAGTGSGRKGSAAASTSGGSPPAGAAGQPAGRGVDWATTMAEVAAGAPTLLVDASGRVLGAAEGEVPGLPVLLGIPDPGVPGAWLPGMPPGQASAGGTSPTSRLLQLAADVPAVVSVHVASLQVNADGTLAGTVTVLPAPAAGSSAGSSGSGKSSSAGVSVPVQFGDGGQLPAKVVALQTLLADVDLSQVTSVDVSDPQRAYLTGNPQPSSVSTTAGG